MLSQFSRFICSLALFLCVCSCTGAQEAEVRRFLQKFAGPPVSDEEKATRYFAAFVHLNDGDAQQVIVHLLGGGWCGSGGCTTLILVPKDSSYRVLTRMTVAQLPIRVLDNKTNGWHDLGVWVQGGGVEDGYEARVSFNGKKYPSNPTVFPAQRLKTKIKGKVVVPQSVTGEPLYP